MSGSPCPVGSADAGALAPAPPFPRLEEDKCNRKHSKKGRFAAEMNLLGYIREHGENNVAELVVTAADCLSSKEFQKKWHSFLTGFLKKRFPSGMWTRERQPRSGNWHAHCAVNISPADLEKAANYYRNVKTSGKFSDYAKKYNELRAEYLEKGGELPPKSLLDYVKQQQNVPRATSE